MKVIPIHKTAEQIPASSLNFDLPYELQCGRPTEVRGIARDEVRLMVSYTHSNGVEHAQFKQLDQFLREGDVLVVNTSGTLKAALAAKRADGTELKVHFSTPLPQRRWVAELRSIKNNSTKRFYQGITGEVLHLQSGGKLRLVAPYYKGVSYQKRDHLQLWEVELDINQPLDAYLDKYGTPIRYNYVKETYPHSYYQTAFVTEMGSTEMPSAGRAFTPGLITRLVAKGIQILPILLHTGVASLEAHEKPYDEYYRVSRHTADQLNFARKQGRRIIAVGTTVIRALESITDHHGHSTAGQGWTDVFITPSGGIYSANGLLTGFHEPKASHLLMLEALAGRPHLEMAYRDAVGGEYQWHEFGDLHLILP